VATDPPELLLDLAQAAAKVPAVAVVVAAAVVAEQVSSRRTLRQASE
jgi:hypothetical protein